MGAGHDVAVIGAGILGAAAAYHLGRAGRRVVVLEAGEPGEGTSARSFAWINAVRKEPEAYHRLNAAGMAEYPGLAAELETDVGYHEGGSLEWAERDAEVAELTARVARLAKRGYPAELITRDAAGRLEPALDIPGGVASVAFFAADGWVDAPRLVRAFLAGAAARGAAVRRATPVRALRAAGGRVQAAVTDAGEVEAGQFLLCVGPATRGLVEPLAVKAPVGRVPGLLAVTSPPARPLGRVVHAPGIHLRPDAGGGLLLGAEDVDRRTSEDTPPAPPPDFARLLLERARRVLPALADARLVAARVGIRPMPGDGHAIAGRIPGYANAWVMATHSGVTLGPLLGRLIAAEIGGAPRSPLLELFGPERFSFG